MNTILWAAALIILQGVIAALAKRAQEKRKLEMQAKGQQRPPASPQSGATAAPRAVVRPSDAEMARAGASSAGAPLPPPAPRAQPMPVRPPMTQDVARARAQADAQYRARVQAQQTAQARAKMQAQAQVRAAAQAKAEAEARAQLQAKARQSAQATQRGSVKPRSDAPRSALQRAADRAGGESASAMHSRDRVQESLARVKAAERKVADALPGEVGRVASVGSVNPLAAGIRGMLRDPNRVREAFVLSEILGAPRGAVLGSATGSDLPFASR